MIGGHGPRGPRGSYVYMRDKQRTLLYLTKDTYTPLHDKSKPGVLEICLNILSMRINKLYNVFIEELLSIEGSIHTGSYFVSVVCVQCGRTAGLN